MGSLTEELIRPVLEISPKAQTSFRRPVLDIPADLQGSMLRDRISHYGEVPGLRLNTVQHRQRISTAAQIDFQVKLLRALRQKWQNDDTEAKFLEAVRRLETDGAALFGGLIDPSIFAKLVEGYDKVQAKAGNRAFSMLRLLGFFPFLLRRRLSTATLSLFHPQDISFANFISSAFICQPLRRA